MSYWYLASPYSKYEAGLDAAFRAVSHQAALFVNAGISVYSPIAHTHPIAQYGGINPRAHDLWLPFDKPLFEGAKGLIVLKLPGWDESYGIRVEIEWAKEHGKPVVFMEPNELPLAELKEQP